MIEFITKTIQESPIFLFYMPGWMVPSEVTQVKLLVTLLMFGAIGAFGTILLKKKEPEEE